MGKGTKRPNPKKERESRKQIEKQAFVNRDVHLSKLQEDSGQMGTTATWDKKIVFTTSGKLKGDQKHYYEKLFKEYGEKLPWIGKEQKESRSFEACSEARAWVEIKSKGDAPSNYTIMAHNQFFKAAPPCKNCSQWVHDTFKKVIDGDKDYRPYSTQGPRNN